MSDIKIFISCHKPCERAESGSVVPAMQADVVRALSQGSGEDRFMAERANEYCELLTQYWAWKYSRAEYCGFGHYRRYFAFAGGVRADGDGIVRRLSLNAETARELGLADDDAIARAVQGYDVLAPVPVQYPVGSAYAQYKNSDFLNVEDLDIVLDIILSEYPAYAAAAREYMRGRRLFYCNMFVMRRELFCEYSEWLFSVLRRFYERRDMRAAGYGGALLRTPGHLGERLFGIWLTRLCAEKKYRVGYLPMAVFENADPVPALAQKGLSLLMPVCARTAPFVAAALRCVPPGAIGEALLLENGLSEEDKQKLAASGGMNVRFCCAARVFAPLAWSPEEVEPSLSAARSYFAGKTALWSDGYTLFSEDAFGRKTEGEIADISACGERMPARAAREFYPTRGYSARFWSLFQKTPFYGERGRKAKFCECSLVWKLLFKLFPSRTKAGCFLRKVRRRLKRG